MPKASDFNFNMPKASEVYILIMPKASEVYILIMPKASDFKLLNAECIWF